MSRKFLFLLKFPLIRQNCAILLVIRSNISKTNENIDHFFLILICRNFLLKTKQTLGHFSYTSSVNSNNIYTDRQIKIFCFNKHLILKLYVPNKIKIVLLILTI